jgi:hypothetical protein
MIGPPRDMAETPGQLSRVRMNVVAGMAVGISDAAVA